MRVVAIIQARMGSTRLPGKVLMELSGEPMLVRCVSRTSRAQMTGDVVVATTVRPGDGSIADLCAEHGWACFRGSENDVLDRYYQAAREYRADAVVRITSDCPLIEPEIVDRVVQEFLDRQPEVDYACNWLPRRTFPRGLDVEVMSFDVLKKAWLKDSDKTQREHVTPYIHHNSHLFVIHGIVNEEDYSYMRWTVDTAEDLAFVRCIYNYFEHDLFSWLEVIDLLKKHPEWLEINRHIQQKVI